MSNFSNVFSCSIKNFDHMSVCKELHDSCRDQGYFLIKDFDAKGLNLASVFAEAVRFFKLPEKEKTRNIALRSNQYLGYRGIGTEKSVLTEHPELCEQYKFGYLHNKETNSTALMRTYLSAYESIFKKYVESYFEVMEQLATKILGVIADNFNLGHEYFLPYCTQPTHQMGMNYYPSGSEAEKSEQIYAMSAHKDLCLLTIIAEDHEGLMVQNARNEWKLIPHMQNTLIVLLGDYLERWTNGYYLAPMHRVIESSKTARISLIYKHRPNYETVIPIIPGINPHKPDNNNSVEFHTGMTYERKINKIMSGSELLMRKKR